MGFRKPSLSRRARAVGAVGALASTTLVASTHGIAAAFPDEVNHGVLGTCSDDADSLTFRVNDTQNVWTATDESAIADGADDWSAIRDVDGAVMTTVTSSPTGQVEIYPVDLGTTDYASSRCELDSPFSGDNIKMTSNPALLQALSTAGKRTMFFRNVSRHELGHQLGLEHTGSSDSPNGFTPTMATCMNWNSTQFANKALSQDDWQYFGHVHSDLGDDGGSSISPITANFGFENGSSFWAKTGGDLQVSAVGGATGPQYVSYKSQGAGNYLYQTATFLRGTNNYDLPGRIRAAINVKTATGGGTGRVQVAMFVRDYNYFKGSGECDYPWAPQNGEVTVGAAWVQKIANTEWNTTSGWTYRATNYWEFTPLGNNFQLQLRLRTVAPAGGSEQYVHLDNIRLACANSDSAGRCAGGV